MKATGWEARLAPLDHRPDMVRELLADLAESERSDAIHLEALATAMEQLRLATVSEANAEAEANDLRDELADYRAYYEAPRVWMPMDKFTELMERIETRRKA